jgi:hypothetical protein
MPSRALQEWRTTQRADLDRLEAAVRGAPERALRQQLLDAYIVLVAAHFQRYCRGLHDEAIRAVANQVLPASLGQLLGGRLRDGRQLDRGNARPSALQADFGRFRMDLWDELIRLDARNRRRYRELDQLNAWRNAVAHQGFPLSSLNATAVAGTTRTLRLVRAWRGSCAALARQIDRIVSRHLAQLIGTRPW